MLQCFIGPALTQRTLVVKWNDLLFLTPICFCFFGETAKKTGKIDPYYRDYVDHELYIIIIIIIIARCIRRRIRPLHCPPNPPSFPSRAAALATLQLFYPTLPLSLSTVLPQVVFGPPLILRLSVVHPNTVKQSFMVFQSTGDLYNKNVPLTGLRGHIWTDLDPVQCNPVLKHAVRKLDSKMKPFLVY